MNGSRPPVPEVPPAAVAQATPVPIPIATEKPETSPPAEAPAALDDGDAPPAWSEETAESEFRAEARDRGETWRQPRGTGEAPEETDAGALPELDELVARLPAAVRDTLEDLFRARFVAVKRVPRKALKP